MYKSAIIPQKITHSAKFTLHDNLAAHIFLDCSCGWYWLWFSYLATAKETNYFDNPLKRLDCYSVFKKNHKLTDDDLCIIDFQSGNALLNSNTTGIPLGYN